MKSYGYIFLMALLMSEFILPFRVFANSNLIFSPGQKLKYMLSANEKIYGFNVFNIKSRKSLYNKMFWMIEGQGLYQAYQSDNVTDSYSEKISFGLSKDYKLLQFKSEVKKNGRIYEKWDIRYKNKYYDYRHHIIDIQQLIRKRMPVANPICFYDANYPWTAEIILKTLPVNPETAGEIITVHGIKTVKLTAAKTVESPGKKVFLLNESTKIVADPQDHVSEIQTGNTIIRKTDQEVAALNIEGRKISMQIPSNTLFIRPELLSYLHVKVKEGMNFPIGAKTVATLDSPRQTFQGNADNDGVDGEVLVSARPNPPGDLISFPLKQAWKATLAEYVKPEDFIDSAHPQIIAKAKEITAKSQTIGAAAESIAEWVSQNVQYQAVAGESALETLVSKKGVCRNFSRLTLALCRAVNIPARGIIGIACLDQSFGYHEWVEIYFGEKDGWIAMDPTIKQIQFVDASHIGLTEGVVNWQSPDDEKNLEVLDFQPSSAGAVTYEHVVDLRRIWQKYRSFDYDFLRDGKDAGSYGAKLDKDSGQRLVLIEDFKAPGDSIQMTSQYILTERGNAIRYQSTGKWQGHLYENEVEYGEPISQHIRFGEQNYQKSVRRMSQNLSQAEGFSFFEWGLVLARLMDGVQGKTEKQLTVYMPDIHGYMNIEAAIEPAEIDFLGTPTAGMKCKIRSSPYSRHVLITKEGIITRLEIPEIGVVVTLHQMNRR